MNRDGLIYTKGKIVKICNTFYKIPKGSVGVIVENETDAVNPEIRFFNGEIAHISPIYLELIENVQ